MSKIEKMLVSTYKLYTLEYKLPVCSADELLMLINKIETILELHSENGAHLQNDLNLLIEANGFTSMPNVFRCNNFNNLGNFRDLLNSHKDWLHAFQSLWNQRLR